MTAPRRAALAPALGGVFTLSILAGCQTEGGFGATVADVRDSIGDALGLETAADDTQAAVESTVKEPLQELAEHQQAARDQVQLTYQELDTLTRTPEDELDAYTQAVQAVRDQAGVTARLRGEALDATDGFVADATRTLTDKVSNPSLRRVAQRNLDAFKTSAADAVAQTGRYDIDLNPLLNGFDRQAAALKQGATDQTVGRVRAELAGLKAEVDGVLTGLDGQVVALNQLIDQVDVIDASLRTTGF